MDRRLQRDFFRRDVVTVARDLLGCWLVRVTDEGVRLAGLIVETEAYLGVEDRAAHTFGGRRTPRNQSMWGDGGLAYVYFTYGLHHCVNVVAGRAEEPVAALIRALAPTEGLDVMRERRPAARRDRDLCSGPAKLTQALGIDRSLDGEDLVTSDRLFVERGPRGRREKLDDSLVVTAARVGVAYAEAWATAPLRFYLADSEWVSRR